MLSQHITTETFLKLQSIPENKICFECGSSQPSWASLPNGIFLCYECSGLHRGIGMHLSFVRSITIDSWSEKQLRMMINGGNKQMKEYFTSVGIYNHEKNSKELAWKYKTKAGAYYREKMRAIVEERELPIAPKLEDALEVEEQQIFKPVQLDYNQNQQINPSYIVQEQQSSEKKNSTKEIQKNIMEISQNIQVKSKEIAVLLQFIQFYKESICLSRIQSYYSNQKCKHLNNNMNKIVSDQCLGDDQEKKQRLKRYLRKLIQLRRKFGLSEQIGLKQ